jgi:hypothetical protein
VPHTKKRDDSLVKPPFLGDIKNERGNILRSPSIDPSRLPKSAFFPFPMVTLVAAAKRSESWVVQGVPRPHHGFASSSHSCQSQAKC